MFAQIHVAGPSRPSLPLNRTDHDGRFVFSAAFPLQLAAESGRGYCAELGPEEGQKGRPEMSN